MFVFRRCFVCHFTHEKNANKGSGIIARSVNTMAACRGVYTKLPYFPITHNGCMLAPVYRLKGEKASQNHMCIIKYWLPKTSFWRPLRGRERSWAMGDPPKGWWAAAAGGRTVTNSSELDLDTICHWRTLLGLLPTWTVDFVRERHWKRDSKLLLQGMMFVWLRMDKKISERALGIRYLLADFDLENRR